MISTLMLAAAALCALSGAVAAGWVLFWIACACLVLGVALQVVAAVIS